MSDDLEKKIKQISELLGGQDNLSDNIKGLLSLLSSNDSKTTNAGNNTNTSNNTVSSQSKENNIPLSPENTNKKIENTENDEMMRKITKLMGSVNPATDPRINLLLSLKPFLNSKRQNRLNTCIKMLNMGKLTRLLDENDNSIL